MSPRPNPASALPSISFRRPTVPLLAKCLIEKRIKAVLSLDLLAHPGLLPDYLRALAAHRQIVYSVKPGHARAKKLEYCPRPHAFAYGFGSWASSRPARD